MPNPTDKRLEPAPLKPPPGWWSCRDMSGAISAVIAAVDSNADIPPHWKAAIKADIEIFSGQGFNFVYLDVHFHVAPLDERQSPGKRVMAYDATPDKKLL